MSSRILILYGTSYGQTAKVARHIADTLTNRGDLTKVIDADAVPPDLELRDFGGVIIGASVIRGQHQRCVRRFVTEHRDALNAMPSAFLSVSGSAASRDERGHDDARRCIEEFLRDTGWRPALTASVAGAMAFTKYNPLMRWVLKQISKRAGGPTDTSRDHELTDWQQVEQFAEAFLTKLPQSEDAPLSAVSFAACGL